LLDLNNEGLNNTIVINNFNSNNLKQIIMSLDVSLISKTPTTKKGTGVFIRENGKTKELTVEEVHEKFPNAVVEENKEVYWANITHNLGKMAGEAGIYEALWRPEEIGATKASDIIPILEKGFEDMKAKPEYYKQFDSPNGWGLYVHFLPWVESYLNACREYPDAIIEVSR
jgi:hypothetical protein